MVDVYVETMVLRLEEIGVGFKNIVDFIAGGTDEGLVVDKVGQL